MPPPVRNRHHPSQSQESDRGGSRRPPRAETLDIFADPPAQRSGERRTRRNSESSVAEHKSVEDEQKRRKERERRHRERPKDSSGRPIPSSSKHKKPSRRLDIIDKLDVTSIYGTGCRCEHVLPVLELIVSVFHHDGPFDAVNAHRNRKNSSRAPMQAFAKDSLNNTLGGSGPVNKNIDLDRFHGHTEDSFKDFNSGRAVQQPEPQYEQYIGPNVRPRASSKSGPNYDRSSSFNPSTKVDPLHGEESLGLGTSTFFEGTPAARAAIERRESESEGVGLTRKKSIAQKIRGISNNRPRRYEGGEVVSPGPRYERTTSPETASAGGALNRARTNERNPFFQDYDTEYDKKGASIRFAEQQQTTSSGENSRGSPPLLTRSITEGGASSPDRLAVSNEQGKPSGGFLSRVKSLRGGGRGKTRPERPA